MSATVLREETLFRRFVSEFCRVTPGTSGSCGVRRHRIAGDLRQRDRRRRIPYDLAQLGHYGRDVCRRARNPLPVATPTFMAPTTRAATCKSWSKLYGLRISLAVGVGSALFAGVPSAHRHLAGWQHGSDGGADVHDHAAGRPAADRFLDLVALMIPGSIRGKGVMNVVDLHWLLSSGPITSVRRSVRATAMAERQRVLSKLLSALCVAKMAHHVPAPLPELAAARWDRYRHGNRSPAPSPSKPSPYHSSDWACRSPSRSPRLLIANGYAIHAVRQRLDQFLSGDRSG